LTIATRLEKDMKPTSESTKLESQSGFKEYVGSGKLKGKSVLITGGEYTSPLLHLAREVMKLMI
jgi:hypothetical protein